MNTLSWTLYLVDVVYGTAFYLFFLCIGSIFIGAVSLFIQVLMHETPIGRDAQEKSEKFFGGGWKKTLPLITYPLIVLFFLQLIPAKETAYLILASEAGEYAATTEDGKEIISDLKEIIQVQLDNLKEPKSEK